MSCCNVVDGLLNLQFEEDTKDVSLLAWWGDEMKPNVTDIIQASNVPFSSV